MSTLVERAFSICWSQWHDGGLADDAVPRDQWNIVHDAGGRDNLVRRIAPEVKACGGSGDVKVDGPDVKSAQKAGKLTVVEFQAQPPKLSEFGNLPHYDCRNRPSFALQQGAFSRAKFIAEGEYEYMRVKIQHWRAIRRQS